MKLFSRMRLSSPVRSLFFFSIALAACVPMLAQPRAESLFAFRVGSMWIYSLSSDAPRLDTVRLTEVKRDLVRLPSGDTMTLTIAITDNGIAWCNTPLGFAYGAYSKHSSPVELDNLIDGKLEEVRRSNAHMEKLIAVHMKHDAHDDVDYYLPGTGLVMQTRDGRIIAELVQFLPK